VQIHNEDREYYALFSGWKPSSSWQGKSFGTNEINNLDLISELYLSSTRDIYTVNGYRDQQTSALSGVTLKPILK